MRFRSEWLTLFTLTVLVAAAAATPRAVSPQRPVVDRADMTAAGIDDRPVGSIRTHAKPRPDRAKAAAVRP